MRKIPKQTLRERGFDSVAAIPRQQWVARCRMLGIVTSLTLLVTVLGSYATACANEVSIPLTIPLLTLREAIKRAIYTGLDSSADLWTGLDDCQYLRSCKSPLCIGAACARVSDRCRSEHRDSGGGQVPNAGRLRGDCGSEGCALHRAGLAAQVSRARSRGLR